MDIKPSAPAQLPPPVLIGPTPPETPLKFLKLLRVMKENPFAAIPSIAYEKLIWDANWIIGHLVVSDPTGIRRVLLDNAANYPRSALASNIQSRAFGEGIHVSDGEKWRTRRRIMSPAFDRRSIALYAPGMVEAAKARLRTWDLLGVGGTVDILAEMRSLTREVVLQTMFSEDATTVDVALERALREGFEHLNFSPFDMSPLIGPILLRLKLNRVRSKFEVFYAAMERLIAARGRSNIEQPTDLLDYLMAATDGGTGKPLTRIMHDGGRFGTPDGGRRSLARPVRGV